MTDLPNVELDTFRDSTGELRRCGSLQKPPGFVSSFRVFEDERPVWSDEEIIKALRAPGRRIAREVFGDKWIQNQRSHGSCNGYAAAAALSRARWLRGIQDGLILSGAYIYSLINGGRDQGSMLEDGLRVIQSHGAPPESLVPWNMIYPRMQPPSAREEAAKRKGLDAYLVKSLQGLKTALAAGYPCIVAVQAGSNFDRQTEGVSGVDRGGGNHAVCCDDLVYRDGVFLYDDPNSWSLNWGTRGRTYLIDKHFAQTFDQHGFYAIPSTTEAGN